MSFVVALSLCAVLLAVELLARAVRLRCFLQGAGYRLGVPDLCVTVLFSDAAALATPMRVGSAARWLGLRTSGVAAGAGMAVLAVEAVVYLFVLAFSCAAAAWLLGAEWWAQVGPRLGARLGGMLPVLAGIVVLNVAVWLWVRRRRAAWPKAAVPTLSALRGAAGWPLLPAVPLTLVSIAARLAILPILAQTLPDPPQPGVLLLGSFALIYGQMFIPTPGGTGTVELMASIGTAGELGGSGGTVFLGWRALTMGLPIALGFALAVHRYGGAAVGNVLRGGRPADPPPAEAARIAHIASSTAAESS